MSEKILKRLELDGNFTVGQLFEFIKDLDKDIKIEHYYDHGNVGGIEVIAIVENESGEKVFVLDGPYAYLDTDGDKQFGREKLND